MSSIDVFEREILEVCVLISASEHTRKAYRGDARAWLAFCRQIGIAPAAATPIEVAAWVDEMRGEECASKTRARRVSALSSIYDWFRRNHRADILVNPFSISEGPKREPVHTEEPTPIADVAIVRAVMKSCDEGGTFDDVRDAALLRILWATGLRVSSLIQITRERLSLTEDPSGYGCVVPAKRGKDVRLWFGGKALEAFDRYTGVLKRDKKIVNGAAFRMSTGTAMDEKDVWRAVSRRGDQAGGDLSPHQFRVAFLTLNPAQLDALQDAAGHSDPKTTNLYRRNWKGMTAFTSMPEIEDV